jgi:hypothetical protein
MTSILDSEYVEPTRPYSQKELEQIRIQTYRSMRLGKTRAHHGRCDHFYNVKENGRKEKQMKEQKSSDVGNCSVCWKLSRTPRHLNKNATSLIIGYSNNFYEDPSILQYGIIDLEKSFYKWLYEEFN